jgi:membrane protein involved in colicin uptake
MISFRSAALISVLFLACGSSNVSAQQVRYMDSSGNIHFVDSINKVPQRYRLQVATPTPAAVYAPQGGNGFQPQQYQQFQQQQYYQAQAAAQLEQQQRERQQWEQAKRSQERERQEQAQAQARREAESRNNLMKGQQSAFGRVFD